MNGVGAAEIRGLLAQGDLFPSRALGQNFLADPNIASKIATLASASGARDVVEIGPGLGSLTVHLAEVFDHVLAIDFDRNVLEPLAKVLKARSLENVEVIHGDAMKMDLRSLLDESGRRYVLAANLPYNLASQIILRVLETVTVIEALYVMVQLEMAERICGKLSTKSYSALSAKVAFFAEARVVMRVSPEVFIPRPNVRSAVVEIKRLPDRRIGDEVKSATFALIRAGFAHRRQMLRKSLSAFGGELILEETAIDPTLRAENLPIQSWISLGETVVQRRNANGG